MQIIEEDNIVTVVLLYILKMYCVTAFKGIYSCHLYVITTGDSSSCTRPDDESPLATPSKTQG